MEQIPATVVHLFRRLVMNKNILRRLLAQEGLTRTSGWRIPPRVHTAVREFEELMASYGVRGKVQPFNSGYVGVTITLPWGKFLYLDQPGVVGLEDQSEAYIAFGKYGRLERDNAMFWQSYRARSFGDVQFKDADWKKIFLGPVMQKFEHVLEARTASYTGNPDGQPIYPNEIDHGYEKPVSGGSDVMKVLIKDLRREQGRQAGRIQVRQKTYFDGEFTHKEKNQYVVWDGSKKLGDVWRGMDNRWHATGVPVRFSKRQDAVDALVTGDLQGGREKPVFE